ncbi:MAG: C1 family peptidase [Capsulimonadaceae bacterium]
MNICSIAKVAGWSALAAYVSAVGALADPNVVPPSTQPAASAPVTTVARPTAAAAAVQAPLPGMGFQKSSDADIAHHAHVNVALNTRGSIPSHLELRDYLPPVAAQGAQNSSVAWAVAYYLYTYETARERKLAASDLSNPQFQFSPAFLYNQGNGGLDQGMSMVEAFDILKDQGCAPLALMPYDPLDFKVGPSAKAADYAKRYRARQVATLFSAAPHGDGPSTIRMLETYLAETKEPFAVGIPLFRDFPRGPVSSDYVYSLSLPSTSDNMVGLHAVAVVGYDQGKHAFLVVNSWGTDWGDNGFLWVSDEFIADLGFEAWTCVPGGPMARGQHAPDVQWTEHVSIAPPAGAAR